MFKLFSKKDVVKLHSPANGRVIKIEEVNDEMFANKMLGDGFAVQPEGGIVFSPCVGEVISIFSTKHAICIKDQNGLEVLVHMGIDTVELDGLPFTIKVKEGEHVDTSTVIAHMDIKEVLKKEKETDIIVVFTNMDAVETISIEKSRYVSAQEIVGELKLK
ncbi:PTS sugar transporter subunit IIA [Desnuesiella massiliensis]|uniref:PTS sugar transporter subunit IIA n=1 Tax=Desnuesiella massiliensis TaxID=1650662 RepID=UPI0006E131C3|nr:PTS glucose transporter subunit IIA [Desnuesiella massiliensis]